MEYKTIRETAEAMGVKVRTIRAWLSNGQLKGVKIGKAWMIPIDEIRELSNKKYTDFSVKVNVDGGDATHIKSNTTVDIDLRARDGAKMRDALKIRCRAVEDGSIISILNASGDVIVNMIL